MTFKRALQSFWHFIWHEDSLLSLLANIILAFVVVKFIFFPTLGFLLGTSYPVVAVVSSSMEHDGSFDAWWNSTAVCSTGMCTQELFYAERNISKETFKSFSFKNGFNKGDVMVLTNPKNAEVGDIIVFFAKDGRPIIHRVIAVNPMQTKGDHNVAQITPDKDSAINEKYIEPNTMIGKAVFRLPFLGYIKIAFVELVSLFGVRVS